MKSSKLSRIQETYRSLNQFESSPNKGKTLLVDSDFHIYKASATVKKLDTAIRRYFKLVLEDMFYVGVDKAYAFFTPNGCAKCNRYFYPSIIQYQSNREDNCIPLKDPLKEYLSNNLDAYKAEGITIVYDDYFEADDMMMMYSYRMKDKAIICSSDKDLRITPYAWFDQEYGEVDTLDGDFGYLVYDNTKAMPLKGRGRKFFLGQLLMGDTADSVKGILTLNGSKCGAYNAYKFLDNIEDESEAVEEVVKAYAKINQDVLAEAEMLWLRRSVDDDAYTYLMEHVQNYKLRNWLESLHSFHIEYIENYGSD